MAATDSSLLVVFGGKVLSWLALGMASLDTFGEAGSHEVVAAAEDAQSMMEVACLRMVVVSRLVDGVVGIVAALVVAMGMGLMGGLEVHEHLACPGSIPVLPSLTRVSP